LGGFAHNAVFDSRFCYKVPDSIEPKYAGPLMCAGATVFSALYNYNVSPTHRIGIVGIGGLGHLALQFSRAWGCHVVAISTNTVSMHCQCGVFTGDKFTYVFPW
jgi:D-arabinose 1-dehydrogenase-like Zn-dependent alcohol dehydrogenase